MLSLEKRLPKGLPMSADVPFETRLERDPHGGLRIVTVAAPMPHDDLHDQSDDEPDDETIVIPDSSLSRVAHLIADEHREVSDMSLASVVRAWIGWADGESAASRLVSYHTRRDCEFLDGLTVEEVEITPNPRLLRRSEAGGHLRTDTGGEWKECVRCRERRW